MNEAVSHTLEAAIDIAAFAVFCFLVYRYIVPPIRNMIDSYRQEIAAEVNRNQEAYNHAAEALKNQMMRKETAHRQIGEVRERAFQAMNVLKEQMVHDFQEEQERLGRNLEKMLSLRTQEFNRGVHDRLWSMVTDELRRNPWPQDVHDRVNEAAVRRLQAVADTPMS